MVLGILKADRQSKLKLVSTGTRIFERTEQRGLRFPFRLSQEGVHCLLPYMSKQLLFARRDDFVPLLLRHSVGVNSLQSDVLREAVNACEPGCVVVVLDETGSGSLVPGERPMLMVAAMRSVAQPGFIELNVKKAEAQSMLRKLGHVVDPPRPAGAIPSNASSAGEPAEEPMRAGGGASAIEE